MIGAPAQEAEIITQALALRDDPVGFVHWAYPWGRPGTVLEHLKGPRKWQMEDLVALADHTQEQAFRHSQGLPLKMWKEARASGRGPGKSSKFGMCAHWHMSTHLGSTTIVAANTEAMHPAPRPTTTPHSRYSCHGLRICLVARAPRLMTARAPDTTRRSP